jgi:asparagine N-glycosylation enzyme membrane subunit Stt3
VSYSAGLLVCIWQEKKIFLPMTFNIVFLLSLILIMLFAIAALILAAPGAKHPKNNHSK